METEKESVAETESEQTAQKQKIAKKKYKATRVVIFSDSEDEEGDDVQIEMSEDVKEEEDVVDIDENNENDECVQQEEVVEVAALNNLDLNGSRKRSFAEKENDQIVESNEPPLKKRKLEETKKIIMSKGVDLFVDMLENGNEDIQNALVDLIQQFEAN